MTTQELLTQFYTSFSKRNVDGMLSCYHEEVVFSDPAFGPLNSQEARAMWTMLTGTEGTELSISFEVLEAQPNSGKVNWKADYKYGPQKKPIHNDIMASFKIKDGKIIEHHDHFDLWKWSRQALGLPGALLGWTPFMRNKIQHTTNKLLRKFMDKG